MWISRILTVLLSVAEQRHESLSLIPGCLQAGLAPDDFHVSPSDINIIESGNPANELWPQTAASLVYMWRATKDPKFKLMGWSIFRSLQEHSRVGGGAFATIQVCIFDLSCY